MTRTVLMVLLVFLSLPISAQQRDELTPAEEAFVKTYLERAKTFAARLPNPDLDPERLWLTRAESERGSQEWVEATRQLGFNVIGRMYSDWPTAVFLLEQAFEFDPSNPSVVEDLGRAYIFTGRKAEGLKLLESRSGRAGGRFLEAFRKAAGRS